MYKSTFFILIIIFVVFAVMVTREDKQYDIVYYDEVLEETTLYLLNNHNQLVQVEYNCSNDIHEIFNLMTMNANKLPLGVRTALPYRLKLNSYKIEDEILYLDIEDSVYPNFSQSVEALVWTFTEIDGISKVLLETNNYNNVSTRDIGINKTIEASNLTDNKLVTVYYLDEYIHPVSYIVDLSVDDVEFIIGKTVGGEIKSISKDENLNIYFNELEISVFNFDNLSHTISKLNKFKSINVYLKKELIYSRYL
ncbi:GerMN domain-containing protein [Mycoplasmatota bacterium WC44]